MAFDGRIHYLEKGYWTKFAVSRVESTAERPHGLRYSFTLHDAAGTRLVGFDNAHGVPPLGTHYQKSGKEYDHWHRTKDDEGRPYVFTTADQLLVDFLREVNRVLAELGVSDEIIDAGDETERGLR
jgi:hypothetical protein